MCRAAGPLMEVCRLTPTLTYAVQRLSVSYLRAIEDAPGFLSSIPVRPKRNLSSGEARNGRMACRTAVFNASWYGRVQRGRDA